MYHPVHGDLASGFNLPERRGFKGKWCVFLQPSVIRAMVAFYSGNDERCLRVVHIFFHAPAFSVCCVRVEKNIVPVEHVKHLVAPLRFKRVRLRQVYIDASFFVSGQLGDFDFPFFNHDFLRKRLYYLFRFIIAFSFFPSMSFADFTEYLFPASGIKKLGFFAEL